MWKFVIIAAFSILWIFNTSEGLDASKKHTGCNSTINANNSAFELNFHNLSKPCYWNLTSTNAGPISLFFFDIFLHEKDELTIYKDYDDAKNGTNALTKIPIPSQNGTITFITKETWIVLKLIGSVLNYDRVFEGYFSVNACSVAVPPATEIIFSPVYLEEITDQVECEYRFNEIPHKRVKQVFTFEEFNMSSSTVNIEGGTFEGEYKNDPPTDFFIEGKILSIKVKQALNSSDHFKLKILEVDSSCSGKFELDRDSMQLKTPRNELNNGSISSYECRWVVELKNAEKGAVLGLTFDKLDFHSVFDIIAVNDGHSEISSPLLQVTTSNRNITQNQVIRASGSSVWISFKPLNYESNAVINVTVHGQGGYLKNNGEIHMGFTTGDDTAFLLEVEDNEVVMLTFDDSSVTPPAAISIYDGFDTSNLLTSLHGQIKFPIFSRSSQMMVIGTKFSDKSNQFTAKFKGVIPGCNHMSTLSTESYILSENCNSSCLWVVPPQNTPNSELVVFLQYISLKEGDNLKIHKLDASLTQLAEIGTNVTHVPHIAVPSDVGILINVTQAACKEKKDKIVLIGHSSYIPACNNNITLKALQAFQISSPLYPDTYPVFTSCHWNMSAPKESIVHMTFLNLNLAKNHCIKISQKSFANKYEGNTLPNDLFLTEDIIMDFDSSGCNKTQIGNSLNSDAGFLMNVTVADCGTILEGKKTGEFNTNITGNKTLCIWKVSVPPTEGDSVNIISFDIKEMDKLKNYELDVYDGSSVRDSKIVNLTEPGVWSRTNTLIFVYRRVNAAQPSGVLDFKYSTISCNTSMQCENKICMHPDWRCNNKNDCGDFTDERNCASVPVPPEVKFTGYSAVAFWLCLFAMTIIGVILGVTVPVCYARYKDSRYRRFHELDNS